MNRFVNTIYDFLNVYYLNCELPKGCYMSQPKQVEDTTKSSPFFFYIKAQLKAIDKSFTCDEVDKVNEVQVILSEFVNSQHYIYTERLNQALRVEFYPI